MRFPMAYFIIGFRG